MSSTVRSYGFIAILSQPLTPAEREEFNEKQWSQNGPMRLNDEGTLLYIDFNEPKPSSAREDIYGLFYGRSQEETVDDFLREVSKLQLAIDTGCIEPYTCIWYNGSDNPVSLLRKEEFLNNIRKD